MTDPRTLTLRLTVSGDEGVAANEAVAGEAWAAVLAVFSAVDVAMSRFRQDSELTTLCRLSPAPAGMVSRMLARALVAADRATRITEGRFDPRVVGALERIGYSGVSLGRVAGADHLRPGARGRVMFRSGRHGPISLREAVDLGGIGKGLALRWAGRELDRIVGARSASGRGYLLDAGGDIVVAGEPAEGRPWHVGIEDPAGGLEPVAVVAIRGREGIATSSVRRLRWERDGRTVHHLIDPRTGEPAASGLLAVTVAGPDPAWAEVWSKALFVEGRAGIGPLARSRGLAAWWVTEDGALEMTPAARIRIAWTASGT